MLYRIVQEQTSNIIKHAEAKNVSFLLLESSNHVLLEIIDDGKGFDTSIRTKGIGFSNIYNRVDAFGGTYTLTSSPGNGCTLLIGFPVI